MAAAAATAARQARIHTNKRMSPKASLELVSIATHGRSKTTLDGTTDDDDDNKMEARALTTDGRSLDPEMTN